MLPRKKYLRALCLLLATAFGASSIVNAPVQAITSYTPPVTVQALTPKFVTKSSVATVNTVQVIAPIDTKPFSVVGITWVGALPPDTSFSVRVREAGKWSSWNELHFSDDHGVDASSAEAAGSRFGTDPLMTAVADAIEVIMMSKSGIAPKDLQVDLIGSQETKQDRALLVGARTVDSTSNPVGAVTSPSGGVVLRPNIVTRAQWGADETWRDPVPRMGTTIVAGFVHHTASTNSYSPEQAPAQMRNLYAYYTKSLKYADMAYNFLVDQYGTVYEGRNACTFGDVNPCDGPSLPVIGAHTAGLNANTFAISAIGNYDTKEPSNPAALMESIAALMAWKIAPYGLDPNANATMISTDTSGLSKYGNGMTAITPVISGHRDVGKTVCPGKYLYPYLPAIRTRATELLEPVIQGVNVTPTLLDSATANPINVSAIIPATATWSVDIKNASTGTAVQSFSGTQVTTGAISYSWDRKDSAGVIVPIGRYAVTVNATLAGLALPGATNVVSIATLPQAVTQVGFTQVSKTKTKVTWLTDSANPAPVTANLYRISANKGVTWTDWKTTTSSEFSAKWKLGKTYAVEVKSTNGLGESSVVSLSHKVRKFAPPKPAAVTAVSFKQLSKNRVLVWWSPASPEFASSGYYYRVSKNGGKYGKWTKSSGLKIAVTLSKWKKNSTYKIQVKVRNITGYSPTVTTSYTTR